MLGANTLWGLMSPLSKFVMAAGVVTPLVVTDMRIAGAMVLFWIASFFQKPNTCHMATWHACLAQHFWALCSTKGALYSV